MVYHKSDHETNYIHTENENNQYLNNRDMNLGIRKYVNTSHFHLPAALHVTYISTLVSDILESRLVCNIQKLP